MVRSKCCARCCACNILSSFLQDIPARIINLVLLKRTAAAGRASPVFFFGLFSLGNFGAVTMLPPPSYLFIEHSIKSSLRRLSSRWAASFYSTSSAAMSSVAEMSPKTALKEYDVDINDARHAERVKSALQMPIEHAFAASTASLSENNVGDNY